MEEPLVSIIVPVYNVRPYLERCLSSIQNQTFRSFEVFLVDDGSTDGSGELCRTYAAADARFHALQQRNAGAAQARNLAMDRARGKYLQFADGDDWLTPDATETFVHTAESTGCDLAVSHFYRVANGRKAERGHIREDKILTRHEFAEHMMKAPANFYYGVLWNKFYRRAIVEANHLRCPSDVSWCEDFLFNLEYFASARLISTISKPLYYYLKREDSIVSTQASLRKTIETKRMTFQEYKELYQTLDLYEDRKATVYRYLISAAVDGAVGPFSSALNGETVQH
ncbi:MAG: glycosyltransferase [Clostridia bacterium]|nr:glycosyltransferase [Clostridia bacterium]